MSGDLSSRQAFNYELSPEPLAGIPVDAATEAVTEDIREELGLNDFVSARLES